MKEPVLGGSHPPVENQIRFSVRFSVRAAWWEPPRFSLAIKYEIQTSSHIMVYENQLMRGHPLKVGGLKLCKTCWPWKSHNLIFKKNWELGQFSKWEIKKEEEEPGWFSEPAPKTETDGSHKKMRTAQHWKEHLVSSYFKNSKNPWVWWKVWQITIGFKMGFWFVEIDSYICEPDLWFSKNSSYEIKEPSWYPIAVWCHFWYLHNTGVYVCVW